MCDRLIESFVNHAFELAEREISYKLKYERLKRVYKKIENQINDEECSITYCGIIKHNDNIAGYFGDYNPFVYCCYCKSAVCTNRECEYCKTKTTIDNSNEFICGECYDWEWIYCKKCDGCYHSDDAIYKKVSGSNGYCHGCYKGE